MSLSIARKILRTQECDEQLLRSLIVRRQIHVSYRTEDHAHANKALLTINDLLRRIPAFVQNECSQEVISTAIGGVQNIFPKFFNLILSPCKTVLVLRNGEARVAGEKLFNGLELRWLNAVVHGGFLSPLTQSREARCLCRRTRGTFLPVLSSALPLRRFPVLRRICGRPR